MSRTMMTICIIVISMGVTFTGFRSKEGEMIPRHADYKYEYGPEIGSVVYETENRYGYDVLSVYARDFEKDEKGRYRATYEIMYYDDFGNDVHVHTINGWYCQHEWLDNGGE